MQRAEAPDTSHRKIVNSWAMYDWANSAFATTVMAAMFPPFYRSMAKAAGAADADATAYWAYTTSIALVLVALAGPVLGAISDHTGRRKLYVAGFASAGVVATALFVFLGKESYLAASVLFIVANIGFAGGNIFYESLLPHICRKGEVDRVSTRGYALGYVGGGTLLVVNVLWFTRPHWFGMPGAAFALRASFVSVAVWWVAFSVPFFRNVPEPATAPLKEPHGPGALLSGLRRVARTFRHIRRYRQIMLFLVAFWLYNDGIGTIIKMATAYGDEIGIGMSDMIAALVVTQFVGVPASFAFGGIARLTGTKRAIMLGLGAYALISVGGFFMRSAWHFYALAVAVGLVQGGTQALSRSFFSAMVPRSRSSEFFGFMSTSSRFAGVAGPVVFALVSQHFGTSRPGIAALVVFFVAGAALLALVDEKEGVRVAESEDENGPADGA